ncbi:hypothetical protein [Streptomyces sp. NPDC048665]|uniref:hypothetical protein n=1 Tax=Streptomyces sp. NPDC048665 TaxID=3155490 RepID=UPI00342F5B6A
MVMFEWWHVLADDERQQWTLDPLVGVGPPAFGMGPDETSQALKLSHPDRRAVSMV